VSIKLYPKNTQDSTFKVTLSAPDSAGLVGSKEVVFTAKLFN